MRAVELCEDGAWHDYEELITVLGRMVEPGPAMRRVERDRLYTGGPAQRTKGSETHRLIASGKRSLVRDFLHKPWFEKKPAGQTHPDPLNPRQIRLAQVPARIQYERRLAAQNKLISPTTLLPLLLEGGDARELLGELTGPQLIRVIEALVARIAVSESSWLQW